MSKCRRFILLLSILLVLGAACTAQAPAPPADLPTLMPTAAVTTPTPPPVTVTPSPTPLPAAVAILSPADGTTIDYGDSVELAVMATDPIGVRLLSLMSNGQGIGTHRGVEQMTLEVTQQWRPEYPGIHRVVAMATGRNGETITTEPVVVNVVDREMLSRNAPIWARVEGNVTEMRGLAPLEPVQPILMSRTELRRRLLGDLYYTEESAQRDLLVYHMFDFLPRGFDLYGQSRRYLGESIAGFYDPETKEFVVVSDDKNVDALEQWIHAHEFMHALQDQHFQLGLITDTTLGFEENLALRALAEGEAELLQSLYIERGYFTQAELVEIFNLINRIRTRDVDYLPPVFVNGFLFPYTTGYDFANTLYQRSGWAGLNNAWADPPRSTEQIIHPDRYFSGDVPQIISLPPLTDTLGTGWQQLENDVLGEFMLREYLAQRLDEDEVNIAATGWGGDRFAVFWHEENDELVLVLRLAWDSQGDANQFSEMYGRYALRRYGPEGMPQPDGGICWTAQDNLCLYQFGTQSLVVRAPDEIVMQQLLDAVRAN